MMQRMVIGPQEVLLDNHNLLKPHASGRFLPALNSLHESGAVKPLSHSDLMARLRG